MKHKKAVYYDRNGERKFVKADSLNSEPEIIVELKNYQLFDTTEEFELVIVGHTLNDKKSHFRLLNTDNSSRFYADHDSQKHDEKVISICNDLNTENAIIKIMTKDFNVYPSVNKVIKILNQYTFLEEVTRETEVGKPFARFDIYGQDNFFVISKKRPEIIIEVIDENFHDKDLFNFLIEKTLKFSLLVIYYFVQDENLYNKCIKNESRIEFRISCYLLNGQFHYCEIPLIKPPHNIETEIDNKYTYFNYVEQNIIKPIKKNQKIKIADLKIK